MNHKVNYMVKIGIVGHRFFENHGIEEYVTNECDNLLSLFKKYYCHLAVVSAIAQGADSIFAQAALARQLRLEIVRPFDNYASDFKTAHSKTNYIRLRNAASCEKILNYTMRSGKAYVDAMEWVVKNSDILIAVWDGQPARGRGGTADAVRYAVSGCINWVHIDVVNKKTFFHVSPLFPHINTQNYYADFQQAKPVKKAQT